MNAKQGLSGYIFVTVLIFLNIFSLMSVYGFLQISEIIKKNERFWLHGYYLLESNKILQYVEAKQVYNSEKCIIPITPASDLANKPISWWQLNTCSDNVPEIRYYYAVELLGNDACSIIKNDMNHQLVTAKYERITLYVIPNKFAGTKFLMQSTIVIPSDEIGSSCTAKLHWVHEGRQMWRYI